MNENPYAPPTALEPQIFHDTDQPIYRVGKWLAVRNGAELPHACTATNEPTGPENWRKLKKIAWTPPWVLALLIVNILVMLIVALCVQKKAKVTYSLSEKGLKKGRLMISLGIFFILLCPLFVFIGIHYEDQYDFAGFMMFTPIIWILIALCCFTNTGKPAAAKHSRGWFLLKNCHPDFLNRFPEIPSIDLLP